MPFTLVQHNSPSQYQIAPSIQLEQKHIRDYERNVASVTQGKTGPSHFLNGKRLPSQFEKFVPEMVAAENLRTPGLNAKCFASEDDFANHIRLAQENNVRGIERALVIVWTADKKCVHCVSYETAFKENGTFIRGYDPLDKNIAEEHFEPMRDALKARDIRNFKLLVYALGLQKAASGCEIFALNAALKSHQWEQDGHNLDDFNTLDQGTSELREDKEAAFIPPYFYKHAQSKSTVERIAANPMHAEWAKAVNKKGQSFLERHQLNRVTKYVQNAADGSTEWREFSNSIDQKRLTFLARLERVGQQNSQGSTLLEWISKLRV